jgi:hypothetical protein
MASYFDIRPAGSKGAAVPTAELSVPENSTFGRTSLLSPQVSAILDDLELEEKSSSEDNTASLSGDSISSDKDARTEHKSRPGKPNRDSSAAKAQASSLPQPSKKVHNAAPARLSVGQRHPHLARFHSLRSMLFQSNIEANMHKAKEDPECQWKAEHEKRQGLNRPKTPETQPKQGFAHKLGNSLRRLTSKEVPTMNSIREVADDNESTASDDEDDEGRVRAAEDSDEINHSDIEDIVRWVSRRDPPSDGERAKTETGVKEIGKEDSGNDSFGHSDVDDLVRWVSRRDKDQTETPAVVSNQENYVTNGDSEPSTQSDSEDAPLDEDEVDDLVRWVSRRDGPNAGPVRGKSTTPHKTSSETDEVEDEVDRWKLREDDASGESDVPDELTPQTNEEASLAKNAMRAEGSSLKTEVVVPKESNAGLAEEDVDELVQWLSRKKSAQN